MNELYEQAKRLRPTIISPNKGDFIKEWIKAHRDSAWKYKIITPEQLKRGISE